MKPTIHSRQTSLLSKKAILLLSLIITHFISVAQLQQIRYSNAATFAIDFYNSQIGALSHYDTLYVTTDNGNTWNHKLQLSGQFTDIKYLTPGTLFASAIKSIPGFYDRWVYKSINNGNTWDSVLAGLFTSNYQKIAIRNANKVALYDNTSDKYILSDFNTHTSAPYTIQTGCNIKNMQFFNNDTAIALLTELTDTPNYAGNIYLKKTTDGGNTWTTLWTTYDNLYSSQASFYNYDHGIIRVDSTFYYTGNAGATWSSFNANVSMYSSEVLQMTNQDVAWCFHDNGLLRIHIPTQDISYITLDSIPYIHNWVYADFIDDNNWFIAENILSCGILGSKIWRRGENENNPTTVSNVKNENEINVFPNPANDMLTIIIPSLYNNQEVLIQLTDMQGKTILRHKTRESKTQMNTSNIADGQYLLKCSMGEHTHTSKIILKH